MTDTESTARRPDAARRAAAIGALALAAAAVVVGAIGLVDDVGRFIVALVLPALLAAAAWIAVTRKGTIRMVAAVAAVAILVLLAAVVLTAEDQGLGFVVVVVLLAGSAYLARYALRRDAAALKAQAVPGTPVGPARQGVLHHEPALRGWQGRAVRPGRGVPSGVASSRWSSNRGDDLLEFAPARHRPVGPTCSAWPAVTARRRSSPRWRRRRACPWSACPPAPATTSPSTSGSTATTSSARWRPSTRRWSGGSTSPR